jgi:hypothetical protein
MSEKVVKFPKQHTDGRHTLFLMVHKEGQEMHGVGCDVSVNEMLNTLRTMVRQLERAKADPDNCAWITGQVGEIQFTGARG